MIIYLFFMFQQECFKDKQLRFQRVKAAFEEKEDVVKSYFTAKGLPYEAFDLFIRGFKQEATLEVWVKLKTRNQYQLLHTYDFCALSGSLGPKRKEGDLQIPEGIYYINHFNPESNFHLSLGINYPNEADKLISDSRQPGSAIYIHGNCVTIGCIPITDDKIKELYILAVEAKSNGQNKIPVHIFPARLDDNSLALLQRTYPQHLMFWKTLQPIFLDFEKNKTINKIVVDGEGTYVMD